MIIKKSSEVDYLTRKETEGKREGEKRERETREKEINFLLQESIVSTRLVPFEFHRRVLESLVRASYVVRTNKEENKNENKRKKRRSSSSI